MKLILILNYVKTKVVGNLDLVPIFGTNFPKFFPIVLIVLCFLTLIDFYGKILKLVGLKRFSFDSKCH